MQVPRTLEVSHYDTVEQLMVVPEPTLKSAAIDLSEITEPWPVQSFPSIRDHSFSRQMADIALNNDIPSPDTFLVTANSAIPVADAIRGFYRAAELPRPHVGVVMARQTPAMWYWHYNDKQLSKTDVKEVSRLQKALSGALERVVIVDQYVRSGETLAYGAALLRAAGVNEITGIRGYWYADAARRQTDSQHVTSKAHRPFMDAVGQLSYIEARGITPTPFFGGRDTMPRE